ncbi:MAG: polysaccharide biosynthesis/export family protein [Henriciella sp.]|nr:polysaccharide biosynthesis/export family protein [Henriciella sp.]
MNRLLCLALVPFFACGCQSIAPAPPAAAPPVVEPERPAPPIGDTPYLLAPGDQLEIIVHTAPDLSRTVIIGPDGEIRIPYSGPIQASKKSLEAVQDLLRDALATELRNPDVDVLLISTAQAACGQCDR